MSNFIVISPNNEPLRYGPNVIKNQVADAHTIGKLVKFVIGWRDLKDPDKPPTPDNFILSANQIDDPDIIVFVDRCGRSSYLKGAEFNCL